MVIMYIAHVSIVIKLFFFMFMLRIIEMNVKKGTIEITNPAKKEDTPRMFTYDSVYDWK